MSKKESIDQSEYAESDVSKDFFEDAISTQASIYINDAKYFKDPKEGGIWPENRIPF